MLLCTSSIYDYDLWPHGTGMSRANPVHLTAAQKEERLREVLSGQFQGQLKLDGLLYYSSSTLEGIP
jgi:hypothetical protein